MSRYDLVTLGEVMLRLTPEGRETVAAGEVFRKSAGGSELNVAANAALFGARTAFVTKLPDNAAGRYIAGQITRAGADPRAVVWDMAEDARLGVYYYERGASPRKPGVTYDRKNSSAATLREAELPAEMFDTRAFHVSSITFALSDPLRETAFAVLRRMKEAGVTVSFDVNYRAALWSEEEARALAERVMPYADILFVSEESLRRMFGRTEELGSVLADFAKTYGCRVVAATQREAVSPALHHFGSLLYADGKWYREPPYRNVEVVDRLGSGDAYVGAVLGAYLDGASPEEMLSYGNAAAALACTTPGDLPAVSRRDLDDAIASHRAASRDEMKR